MPIVKFVKERVEINVPMGANLRSEALKAGINLNQGLNGIGAKYNKYLNCKGTGLCGTCRVLIHNGIENTNAMTIREKLKFKWSRVPTAVPDNTACVAFTRREEILRLACMTRVHGDIEVESGPDVELFGEDFYR